MKTYIWTLPTRIFHWLLVAGMVVAYLVAGEEDLLNIHSSVGYMIGVLIAFRIIWGFFGPKYSRFTDFSFGLKALKAFITDMKTSKSQHAGHNPGASFVMFGIIICTMLIVVSGALLLAADGQGLFRSIQIGMSSDTLKEIHEIAVNIVIALVILHLIGNTVDFIFNRQAGTLMSMFTGYKNMDAENASLNPFQKVLATVGIIAALVIVPYALTTQKITPETEKPGLQKNENSGEEDDD